MNEASLDDDTLEGSRSVIALEEQAASLTGMDAGLYVVSGTMGNAIASLCHAVNGGEMITDRKAHIAVSEVGGMARIGNLFCVMLDSHHGEMDTDELRRAVRPDFSRYGQPTAMVSLETSHNHSGGYVPSMAYLAAVREIAEGARTGIHIDGARVFNAATALGVPVREIARHCDSMTFCLSKGLSAPMGSILLGAHDFIAKARTFRRMLGGGLRQAGIMAAAGQVALTRMVDRLAEDHARARNLWAGLRDIAEDLVDDTPSGTNIVAMHVRHAATWETELHEAGIAARASGPHTIRFVTHRHVGDADISATLASVGSIHKRLGAARR